MPQPFTIRPIRAEELSALLALYQHLHADDSPVPDPDALTTIWSEIMSNMASSKMW